MKTAHPLPETGLPQPAETPESAAQRLFHELQVHQVELETQNEALRASEEFKQQVLDSVSSTIAVLDADGVIVATNAPWRRFALENGPQPGCPARHTEVGVNYLEVCGTAQGMNSGGGAEAYAGIRAVLAGRLPRFDLEYACHSADEQRWFAMSVLPMGNRGQGVVVAHNDSTERQRVQEQLVASELRYRSVVEDQTEVIGRVLPDGTIVFANAVYGRLIGKPVEELIGNRWHPVAHPDDLPMIEADRGQLQQIVMNLFINGVEALGEKGGVIRLATHTQQITTIDMLQSYVIGTVTPGLYVVLQITDSGIGMEQSVLSRIFDPFFSTKPKGHGLGLSATLGIIRTHQGALQVQSQPGLGTIFTIFLPALPAQATKAESVITPPVPRQEARALVLVIDDEEALREVTTDVLSAEHFQVITTASGLEGIEQFRRWQKQVGVVLLDMKMPGMNGKQTYQILRQIEPAVKVIFMSGYSETEVTSQLDNDFALPFLAKPYTADALVQHVRQMLV